MNPESVTFLTEDGVRIAGTFREGMGEQGIVLLHMMPATKESWDAFAGRLNAEGYDVLAIDLRGHGESVSARGGGGALDYKAMSDEEHRASRLDVLGASRWLEDRGIAPEAIAVAGASFGANLALEYMAERVECPAGVLLSPGRSYRGLESAPLAERLSSTQRICVVAAEDDESNPSAVEDAKEIDMRASSEKGLIVLSSGGHGTDMLAADRKLMDNIVGWLMADLRE